MTYVLPVLKYPYNALEPYIDALTMEIHYTKHHQGYINQLNDALQNHHDLLKLPLEELLKDVSNYPQPLKTAIINHGGGHYNHSLFWSIMKAQGKPTPSGQLASAIDNTFGSFEIFQNKFNEAAKKIFGSGWAWLCLDKNGTLVITSTVNQECPLMYGLKPIMGLDVWEHAYYLQYQNKRPDYINGWWHVLDWEEIEKNYHTAINK